MRPWTRRKMVKLPEQREGKQFCFKLREKWLTQLISLLILLVKILQTLLIKAILQHTQGEVGHFIVHIFCMVPAPAHGGWHWSHDTGFWEASPASYFLSHFDGGLNGHKMSWGIWQQLKYWSDVVWDDLMPGKTSKHSNIINNLPLNRLDAIIARHNQSMTSVVLESDSQSWTCSWGNKDKFYLIFLEWMDF